MALVSHKDANDHFLGFRDESTYELSGMIQPVMLYDDFIGAGPALATTATLGSPWLSKIVGAAPPTGGPVANAAGGVISLALTSASQKQDTVLYMGDYLQFDATKGLVFEARVAFHALPTTSVQAVWGIQSAWVDGPDSVSYYLQFAASASGAVLVRKKDGVATTSASSGVTVVADAYHLYRIDCTDITKVRFLIDGALVGTANFAATGANAVLQPYFSMYKASGTGVGTMYIDSVRLGANR